MSLVSFIEAAFVAAVMVALAYAVLWSLFDLVVRARDISFGERLGWAFLLVTFNVLGAALYVNLGPGRRRWSLWGKPELREQE